MYSFTKRIIILGSSGFIGKWLFEKFSLCSDLEVKGFSSRDCNLLSIDDARDALSDMTRDDVLIMASAITRLRENSFNSMLKNIQMAENVSKVIAEHPVGQIIYLSTIDVYGIDLGKEVKISERLRVNPHSYYAISKIVGEFLLRKEAYENNISLAILRLPGVYGPGDEGKSTIGAFILSGCKKGRVCIYGEGRDLRDYVYVDDIYKTIGEAIKRKPNKTINIGTGRSYSILEIVHMIRSLSVRPFQIEFRPKAGKGKKRMENLIFDCSLLRKEFPHLEMVGLKDGISRYISHSLGE